MARSPAQNLLYVGITGAFASGCTTSAKYLAKRHRFRRISLSEILKREFELKGKQPREEMQDFGDEIRKGKKGSNKNVLMHLALDDVIIKPEKENRSPSKRVVFETIRNPAEAELLLQNVPNAYLLAIYANQKDRQHRVKATTIPKKQKFVENDIRDSGDYQADYGQQVTKCVNMADYHIQNSGTMEDLEKKLDDFFRIISGKSPYEPKLDAIMMSQAFMLRLLSKCWGRRVGAVLVKDDNIISTGWNALPSGMEDRCATECSRKELHKCNNCSEPIQITYGECKCGHDNKKEKSLLEKHLDLCYALHAEEKAILQAGKIGTSLEGATLYCTTFPCLLCAKMIVESGITRLVYVEPYPHSDSLEIFKSRGKNFKIERFEGLTAKHLYSLSI